MEYEGQRGQNRERHPHGEDKRGKDKRSHHRGAKTFRRGRALAFLERMDSKRSTLKRQLETPELQSINPILVGELKAIESVIDEFVQLFEIHEVAETEETNEKDEKRAYSSSTDDEQAKDEFK